MRLGAPGRSNTAASLNTSAGSSTKIESGNCSSGVEDRYVDAGCAQGGDVRLVFGEDGFEHGRGSGGWRAVR